MAAWVGVVGAVSLAIMALTCLLFLAVCVVLLVRVKRINGAVTRLLETLERDARPMLLSARTAVDEASRMAVLVRAEVKGVTDAAASVRERVERAAESLEQRYSDFETLLDVFQGEVEDTVLDVAAALRTTRRGAGVLRAMKRAVRRR